MISGSDRATVADLPMAHNRLYARAVAVENVLGIVRRTLTERALLTHDGPHTVVVACSGGADSGALLLTLARLAPQWSLSLIAASVDHGLRADAAADVAVAAAQAERLGVPFYALTAQVGRHGSLQAAAREARYAALHALATQHGASVIAVGHTQDDQAETVLARILRGGSVRGIGGIAPRRADGVIRPLLDCTRADVRALVRAEGLPFVDDPSNDDRRFLRATLRAEIVPALRDIDPRVVAHLASLADDARAADRALRGGAMRLLTRAGRDAPAIALLKPADPALRHRALARWSSATTGSACSRAHLEALDRLVQTGRGEVRLVAGWVVRVSEGRLVAASGSPPLQRTAGGSRNGA